MKLTRYKYIIVIALLGVFLSKGVVLFPPVQNLLCHLQIEQELLMNAEEEKNAEQHSENKSAEKEFIGEHTSYVLSHAGIVLRANNLLRNQHFTKEVFLPVTTPPPEFIG